MAQDTFIKFNSIEGESQDHLHKGEIDVIRWEWSVSQTANMHNGSGGGAGKSTVKDLFFDHHIDKSSPNLLQYCLNGKHISEVILTTRKAGGSPLDYLVITLQEVLITSVEPFGYDTMRSPRETVGLSFARFRIDYVLQNAQGNTAGTVSTGFDIKANVTM
ncbi:Hcp family type VI secretion system effector [Erwinia sp. AnSW2-5]|uniref:Hcp family type VI secretion system effector n=1 Tax=Erwinia sp. AnSW2-5 TaxID=3367692 RepID=UPI003858E041